MTSAADLVAETERYLLGGQPPSLNRLNGPVGPNATALVFAFDPKSIEPGTYVAVDLELYYVWAVDQPSKTATVDRKSVV